MNQISDKKDIRESRLAIEESLIEAQQNGFSVVVAMRGFRVALNTVINYYIEVIAQNSNQQIDLGFWPGTTTNLAEVQDILLYIKSKYPDIKIATPIL